MKIFLLTFIIYFAINQEFCFAKVFNPPGTLHRNTCCNVSRPLHEMRYVFKIRRTLLHCLDDLGLRNEPDSVILSQHACIIECFGKKLNITDADGKLSEEGLLHFVKYDIPLANHQKDIAGSVAMRCYEKSKMATNMASADAEDIEYNGCGNEAQLAIGCVNIEFINSCPRDLENQSKNCIKMREILHTGKFKIEYFDFESVKSSNDLF